MKIIGNRILVAPLDKEATDGFQTVEVQDDFVYKGRVEQIRFMTLDQIHVGDTILFAKYSPDSHEVTHEGKKYKIIKFEDVLAVL